MTRTIFFIGDDKLGHRAIQALPEDAPIWLNRTMNLTRVLKLLRRRSIIPSDLLAMALADLRRKDTAIPQLPVVTSNADVEHVVKSERPARVVCFRAGLIFNRATLRSGPQFLNIHYADLPAWGGLGALRRALRAGALDQAACLHEMLPEIDAGQVLYREPFRLNPATSFKENEDRAFSAGLAVLKAIASGNCPV